MTRKNETETVTIRQWWSNGGGVMVHTSALEPEHPEHPYNQILAQGKRPEDFGVNHPYTEEFADKTRNQLIEEIINLRMELDSIYSNQMEFEAKPSFGYRRMK